MSFTRSDKAATLAMLAVVAINPLLVSMMSRSTYPDTIKGGFTGALIGLSVLALVFFAKRVAGHRSR